MTIAAVILVCVALLLMSVALRLVRLAVVSSLIMIAWLFLEWFK